MKSGLLRHKIQIQQEVVVRDSFGAESITWSNYMQVYASAKSVNEKEYFSAKQTQSERVTKFIIRYSKKAESINSEMRIVWGSRVFDIEGVVNIDGRNRNIMITGIEKDV